LTDTGTFDLIIPPQTTRKTISKDMEPGAVNPELDTRYVVGGSFRAEQLDRFGGFTF
jgi:hypothetical protein